MSNAKAMNNRISEIRSLLTDASRLALSAKSIADDRAAEMAEIEKQLDALRARLYDLQS